MGSFSIWHWLIVLAVVLLLFGGGGKIPKLMKDVGSGINAFKKGLKEDDQPGSKQSDEPKAIEGEEATTVASSSEESKEEKKAANG